MRRPRRHCRRVLRVAGVLLVLAAAACGSERGGELDEVCLQDAPRDLPSPRFPNPQVQVLDERAPFGEQDEVRHRWSCLDDQLVEDRWQRNPDSGCWFLAETFRAPNPNCNAGG